MLPVTKKDNIIGSWTLHGQGSRPYQFREDGLFFLPSIHSIDSSFLLFAAIPCHSVHHICPDKRPTNAVACILLQFIFPLDIRHACTGRTWVRILINRLIVINQYGFECCWFSWNSEPLSGLQKLPQSGERVSRKGGVLGKVFQLAITTTQEDLHCLRYCPCAKLESQWKHFTPIFPLIHSSDYSSWSLWFSFWSTNSHLIVVMIHQTM